jgi:hypothetical protein
MDGLAQSIGEEIPNDHSSVARVPAFIDSEPNKVITYGCDTARPFGRCNARLVASRGNPVAERYIER